MDDAFIVENGDGVFFPSGYRGFSIKNTKKADGYDLIQLGLPYGQVRRFFEKIRPEFDARGFGDMSVRKIADLTGLSEDQAARAKDREFTKPFTLGPGQNSETLAALAKKRGWRSRQGAGCFT